MNKGGFRSAADLGAEKYQFEVVERAAHLLP